MVKIPAGSKSSGSAREMCTRRFVEWWTADYMRNIMSELDAGASDILASNGTISIDKLAGFLYDMVGPRFLRGIDDDREKCKRFLDIILATVIEKKQVRKEDIIDMASRQNGHIRTISDVVNAKMSSNLCVGMARELGLPPSVAKKERTQPPLKTEIVEAHTPLNPLYDYQYSTGREVRNMLEGKAKDGQNREIKRMLIAVPTGAGKTRMIVQTLVEWLNDKKPSNNTQQHNSKFILWVAQSGELCEQAFSTFRSVFESTGRRGTTLHLHPFWGKGRSLPKKMDDMLDERGVIVATIQSLHKVLSKQSGLLERLGRMTSCIVVDEAHRSITTSYSSVLRKMGFNWDNRKTEISEWGIVLIGLTATPFRGSGDNEETQRLERRYGIIHFPTIPYIEGSTNYKPHALIDCQTSALAGEDVHILGERSYDRDGFIRDTDYYWNIRRLGPDRGNGGRQDWTRRYEWTLQGDKNVSFTFEQPGTYEITLRVLDNEGDSGETSTHIEIKGPGKVEDVSKSEQQKRLYHTLVKRKILCKIYHHILNTPERMSLTKKDEKHLEKFGEFRSETLKGIGSNKTRNGVIVDEIVRLQKSGRKKILFFGCSVEHSRSIALHLKLQGIEARYVDSKMDVDSRVEVIEKFRNSDLGVLCNFGVLTTGFDAPNIDCVFVGRPVKSTLLYTQMIGRGMRGTKSGGTEDVLVVDMDDNFQLQDTSTVELGWKVFAQDWERWEVADEVRPPVEIPVKDTSKQTTVEGLKWPDPWSWSDKDAPEQTAPAPAHACSTCGVSATGADGISETFGIEGPLDILVDYLKDERFNELPAECYKCRMEKKAVSEEHIRSTGDSDDRSASDLEDAARQTKTRELDTSPQEDDAKKHAPTSLTPDQESALWNHFNRIISNERSNTYKFALAVYLLRHACGYDSGPTVRYADIAAAFLRYYWHQVTKYGVRQSPHGHHPPRIVAIIRKMFKGHQDLSYMHPAVIQRASSEIFRSIFGTGKNRTSVVVPKFQIINIDGAVREEKMFYEYSDAEKTLTLHPEALAFFRKNRAELLGSVFEEWARFLERVNPPKRLAMDVQSYLKRHGTQTGEDAGAVLSSPAFPPRSKRRGVPKGGGHASESDQIRCFVCDTEIDNDVHFYPLMPWSYVFESEGWAPVPMCTTCSGTTHDGQAGRRLIRRLVERV